MPGSLARLVVGVLLASPALLVGCSSSGDEEAAPPSDAPPCPTSPVEVVVSVDQWGDIVSELAGACANVTTLLAGSSVDPHDFEPSPADAAKFEGAQLVVINGGHYDEWADKLARSSAPDAPVIDAVSVGGSGGADHEGESPEEHAAHGDGDGGEHDHGGADGGNPHVWYRPATVTAVADAVTAELTKLVPAAGQYFAERRSAVAAAFAPYDDAVARIKAGAAGKTYAATESVFDDMAEALGLRNTTPSGFAAAASNETDPSPADLDAFLNLLRDRGADVLIYNTQTEGSVPEQLRAAAESAGVPVVEVTETVAPGAESFEAWQVNQLTALAEALGVPA